MISLDPYLSSLWMLTLIPVDSQKGKGVWLDPFDEWRPGGKYDTFKRAGLLPRRWSLNMTHREQCCPPLCFIQTPQFWQRKAFFSCASWKKHLCRGKFFFLSSSLCMLDDSMQPMLQSATRTSVISHRDLKEQSDLFSFLYLMAEEANSSLATRCIGTAKECRSVKWLWNETTAWSQLGHPDILETALCPGCHVFCPLIISSCSSLIAERELESWFSVKRLPLFICCFFCLCFAQRAMSAGEQWLAEAEYCQNSCTFLRLCPAHIFYSCAIALPIHESSTTSQSAASVPTLSRQMCDRSGGNTFDCVSLTVQLSHTEHSRMYLMSRSSRLTAWLVKVHKYTDGNREACQLQADIDVILRFITDPHYPLRLCSQPLVLTCHPGLKLIRILSEEKLKRVGDTLPDLPFIWCQENRFDVCTTKPRQGGMMEVPFVPAAHSIRPTVILILAEAEMSFTT